MYAHILILQGDFLAPFLFIIIIDWVLRRSDLEDLAFTMAPRRSRRCPEAKLDNLGFADDIALLSNSAQSAQAQLDTICKHASEVGLIINPSKTKIIAINVPPPKILLYNTEIEVVKDFSYLGSYIASSEHDIKCRKGKAWSAFWMLKRIWNSNTPLKIKIDLFKSSVLSVLLYASETWVLNKHLNHLLNTFQNSCLRIILDIPRLDRVSNAEVGTRTNMRPLTYSVHERQLRFLGHSLRRPPDHIVNKYALYFPSHGRRNRGRPLVLYHQYIAEVLNTAILMSPEEIRRAAQDRDLWRRMIAAACCRHPT